MRTAGECGPPGYDTRPGAARGARAREAARQSVRERRQRHGDAAGGPRHGAAGPLVRPYTVTGGRTRPVDAGLDMISIVVATRESADAAALEPEHAAILRMCDRPVSVAELSAQLDLPITVVKVLLGDLITAGDVLARAPLPVSDTPQLDVLQAVLDGIRRL
ncbi:DUF742 domain-containing protein [Streptomonospora nanhaiensis]|uniref:DUF742 domain-containing protein n=1 Tax=Streptomonospora nanhaiensis TaxID=1323731 RepID=A0A853BXG3_9ACTN|nr:DUF742 domain-containing protein [Streptomonospora nanhaiensis]MBX9389841.1 DUF742 domain-containing protein [Streptomonospora nanhaiensis]NYI98852.1 hypothetical protein [Streptomonospora nanhaiensis]